MKNLQPTLKWAASNRNLLITGAVLAVSAGAACAALWSLRRQPLDPKRFIDEAAEQSVAEMETAKIALQKSSSFGVKAFAQEMFDDHSGFFRSLKTIADRKHVEIVDDATLFEKARACAAKSQDAQNFDADYVDRRIAAHKATIRLFRKAARGADADVRYFCAFILPKLQHHLKMAQNLRRSLHSRSKSVESLHSGQGFTRVFGKSDNLSRSNGNALPMTTKEAEPRSIHN